MIGKTYQRNRDVIQNRTKSESNWTRTQKHLVLKRTLNSL